MQHDDVMIAWIEETSLWKFEHSTNNIHKNTFDICKLYIPAQQINFL
jgi:hypothetical protein